MKSDPEGCFFECVLMMVGASSSFLDDDVFSFSDDDMISLVGFSPLLH